MKQTVTTKKLVILGMFAALAYIVMVVGRIPISAMEFLKYDPKDAVIAIAGFIFGPISALAITVVTSLVEMITVSSTGVIGLVMNVLGTASFACTSTFIYKKKHTMAGALIGLGVGTICMTLVMILWNYLITPLYMDMARADVAAMLVPVFLPFNLIKGGLNAGLTLLLYKPVVTALRKAQLVPPSQVSGGEGKMNWGFMIVAAVVFATFILCALVLKGLI